ncbi:hypothetical protein N9R79_11065 [Vibrio sp.]|nr:hypothetical protein [Vibrio sp.]
MHSVKALGRKIKEHVLSVLDFKSRIWVINTISSTLQNETFVVNEDSFDSPLSWMVKHQYTPEQLNSVEQLTISQVVVIQLSETIQHRVIRVK